MAYQHVRKDPPPPSRRNPALSPELDAVVLKSLAKNPANRYQTAAEMRSDLIRVRDGQAPAAPKVYTDKDHADLASTAPGHRRVARGGSRRWLAVGAILAVLALVVTVAVNVFVGDRQRVPDLHGQGQADAQVSLQNLGFKTIVNPESSSTVQRGLVISTDPGADATARVDDTIAINVSSGPEQRQVPDVAGLSPVAATNRLKEKGFGDVGRTEAANPTVPKGLFTAPLPPWARRPRSPTRSPSSSVRVPVPCHCPTWWGSHSRRRRPTWASRALRRFSRCRWTDFRRSTRWWPWTHPPAPNSPSTSR